MHSQEKEAYWLLLIALFAFMTPSESMAEQNSPGITALSEKGISLPQGESKAETENDDDSTAKAALRPKAQMQGRLRLIGPENTILRARINGKEQEVISRGTPVPAPVGEQTIDIYSEGYNPVTGTLPVATGRVTNATFEMTEIPNHDWLFTGGWVGIGLGGLMAMGAIAVDKSVDFDSPALREATQWSLLGGGGALLVAGGIMVKRAFQLQQNAEKKAITFQISNATGGAVIHAGGSF